MKYDLNFLTCRYEIQKAKITIGPLQCQQDDEEPFDVVKEIKTLKESDELINVSLKDTDES